MTDQPMDRDQILERMNWLDRLLGSMSEQSAKIAQREVAGAMVRYPGSYSNPELAAFKDRLISRSDSIIRELQSLQARLVSGD